MEIKLEQDPSGITNREADELRLADQRAHGNVQKGSITAQVQHAAAENEKRHSLETPSNGNLAVKQSADTTSIGHQQTRRSPEQRFLSTAEVLKAKLEQDPATITKQEANELHSHDRRAHGNVEKGGITAQTQHAADENAKLTNVVSTTTGHVNSNDSNDANRMSQQELDKMADKIAEKLIIKLGDKLALTEKPQSTV